MNLREGFRRICLLLYAFWVVGGLFDIGVYTPFRSAAFWQENDRRGGDYNYSRCETRARAIEATLKFDEEGREQAQRLDGRRRAAPWNPAPYGFDARGDPLTRDQAFGLCESERRRAKDAVEKTSYLRLEYAALLSPSKGVADLFFLFLAPVVVYYCLLGATWAVVRTGRWIKHGFGGSDT